jgi:hypothetical protein
MAKRGKSARAQVPLRIPEALRARIDRAAKEAGNSMNAEIGERLERSFETEDRFGGPQLVELMEMIAIVMRSTGQNAAFYETGKRPHQGEWLALPYAFDQAIKAAVAVLEQHRPPGEVVVPAERVIEQIKERWPDHPDNDRIDVDLLYRRLAQMGEAGATSWLPKREKDKENE